MIRRRTVMTLAALLAMAAAFAVGAQETVTATGSAAILHGDQAQARDRALDSALRAAVEKVVGTMVDSESLVKNNQLLSDKIYTQTKGYISHYDIMSEKADPDTNIYQVTVNAAVKQGDLANDLKGLGILLRRLKMPRVAVALQEQGNAASSRILQILHDRGFHVVDTGQQAQGEQFWAMDENGQANLMKQYGAEVVILGDAQASSGGSIANSQLQSFQASVSLKALKTDTHELLATANGTGKAVHTGEIGMDNALRQAATVAANRLVTELTKSWEKELTSTRFLVLRIQGTTPEQATNIAHRLETEARGVKSAVIRDVDNSGTATLEVSMEGDASDLAQELRKIYPGIQIQSQTANSLTVVP
ncbi:MAG: flagellar assembly protein T N-terminal domain-containing protein [Acidobacteriota bacterium]|jgi:hypothetical protein